MADLSRLREIVKGARARADAGRPAPSPSRELTYDYSDPDGAIARGMPDLDPRDAAPLSGSRLVHTQAGPCVVIEHVFEPDREHGTMRVGESEVYDDEALAVLGRWHDASGRARGRGSSIVFLDLETTGLSGGAGTVAFLVGLGYFEDGAFRTRQFFLTSYQRERALLQAVAESLESTTRLVTFNGKTFDVPIMETRWLFQRMPPPLDGVPHLDFLHPARRLWRQDDDGLSQSCRLIALEQSLLRYHRIGDVPGWEIPSRYFDYIRHGRAGALEPVLHHNRLDLLSLALLTARAQRLIRDGVAATIDPKEWFAVGCLLDRAGRTERASPYFEHAAAARVASTALRVDALRHLGRLRRRLRHFRLAAQAWERLLEIAPAESSAAQEAREALAVHLEHRERNLSQARRYATAALDRARAERARTAVAHRLARLDRKIARGVEDAARVNWPSLLD